jgi:hypothetical protein
VRKHERCNAVALIWKILSGKRTRVDATHRDGALLMKESEVKRYPRQLAQLYKIDEKIY